MKRWILDDRPLLFIGSLVVSLLLGSLSYGFQETIESSSQDSDESKSAASEEEALARAELLHETIRGSLLVIHRDFFDDESPRVLPSQSLDDVFSEIEEQFQIEVRWLTGDGDEMNVDHRPETPFEIAAIEALADGETSFTQTSDGAVHFVGRIPLASQCLKCHVARRTSLEDRFSGLLIRVPVGSLPETSDRR